MDSPDLMFSLRWAIRNIDSAPRDGTLQLVALGDVGMYGPFWLARWANGMWIAEGSGNGTVQARYYVALDASSAAPVPSAHADERAHS